LGLAPTKASRIRLEWCYLFRYTASPDPWSQRYKLDGIWDQMLYTAGY